MRAVGIPTANEVEQLVGVVEVARFLGCDLSTPDGVRRAKHNLASRRLIPSVRISLKFDLADVRDVIERGGNADPHRES